MFLVVGLGNPGAEYEATRHNVGFMAADELHRRYNFSPFKSKFSGLIAEGQIEGEKVYLLKPQTYMNLSGNSVVQAANFYKILPQNIVVIHDDMDLPTDKIKAKIGGGSGGHNGIKSIDSCITPNYNRIRIGVGHPVNRGEENIVNHVLSRFSKQDKENIENDIDIVSDLIGVLIRKGIAEFSNQLGMKLNHK
ncbi:MAG: aminoacyl-tRNA hydrolase [Alphaproteobacteria bacterium]|nr:aminoacyl-tRNA hydrolase [Alphaproteobacteria bacterium]